MYRAFLALRYLWSRPISWVSMVGIWLSVTALIATIAIMTGFLRDTRAMIRGTTSDLVLTPRSRVVEGRRLGPPPAALRVLEVVETVGGVAGVSPHLVRPALIRVPDISPDIQGNRRYFEMNFVQVVGVDPAREARATDFDLYVRAEPLSGDPPEDPARPFHLDPARIPARYRNQDLPVLLAGEKLFELYRLRKGDVVTLVTLPDEVTGDELTPLSQRFLVGGSFRTKHHQHDRSTVFAAIDAVRAFGETESSATEIALRAQEGVDLGVLKARLAARFAAEDLTVDVETWEDRHANFLGAVQNERSILGVLLFFFVAVACFNVFATLTIMVSDKTRDIGVLNAMGATADGVAGVFVLCGLLMSLLASILGCASGVLLAANINGVNDLLDWLLGVRIFREDIYMFAEIPVEIQPWFVVAVFLGTNLFAVLCALLPALRAARMDPVRALRYE